jgi:sortase (surface protein transpeptidase)
MKKIAFLFFAGIVLSLTTNAQKWKDLTDEQKWAKVQEFREDNQKYMKSTLGMTDQQVEDVDAVNACFLSNLDLVARYGKDDAAKEKYAKSLVNSRNTALDAIMGPETRKKYQAYVKAKLEKAAAANQ